LLHVQPKKAIKIYARGGLGNQLFQYGAAYHLSKKLDLPIVVDDVLVSKFSRFNRGLNRSGLELDKFENNIFFHNNNSRFRSEYLSRVLTALRLLGDKFPNFVLSLGTYSNEFQDHISTFNKIDSKVAINAYCSTPAYFGEFGLEISQQISRIKNLSNWYIEWSAKLKEIKPIGLNLRLGDYKNLSSIYGTVDPNYYANSAKVLQQILGEREVWIFSDEPELASELIGGSLNNLTIVKHPENKKPIEYLNLLAQCDGIVCANSSFSWWAGYLATNLNQNSQIIFPRPMFNKNKYKEPNNWLPNNWITLGRKIS